MRISQVCKYFCSSFISGNLSIIIFYGVCPFCVMFPLMRGWNALLIKIYECPRGRRAKWWIWKSSRTCACESLIWKGAKRNGRALNIRDTVVLWMDSFENIFRNVWTYKNFHMYENTDVKCISDLLYFEIYMLCNRMQ